MSGLDLVLASAAVALIGLLRLLRRSRGAEQQREFAVEYHNRLAEYISKGAADEEAYIWLTQRSVRMQIQLGALGVLSSYQLPGSGPVVRGYQVVVNALPEIHHWASQGLFSTVVSSYANLMRDCIVRHTGVLEDAIQAIRSDARNPVLWFREGVESIVGFPVVLLQWLGLLSPSRSGRITTSRLFRVVAAFVAVLGFVSAVVGVVTGWHDFIQILRRLFHS